MKYDPALSSFDHDYERGAQTELWVSDLKQSLASGSISIEDKRDAYFFSAQAETRVRKGDGLRLYIELTCQSQNGQWQPSGLSTTKATHWFFQAGAHSAAMLVAVDILQRAVDIARKNPRNHASCKYGDNPTHGVLVYMNHLLLGRDRSLDEH
jgi:hypothetical protein